MDSFYLKYRDTRPILDVELHDPAPAGSAPGTIGPIHDLTGSTEWKLFIWLADGLTKLSRPMTIQGAPTAGLLRYTWIAGDWAAPSSPDTNGAFTVGGLVVGPTVPLDPGQVEHRMEYEVVGPAGARMTFPNSDPELGNTQRAYDILRIPPDIGQG